MKSTLTLATNVVERGGVKDLFRATNNPKITFLSAGTIPPNPSDILVSKKMDFGLEKNGFWFQKNGDLVSKKWDLV